MINLAMNYLTFSKNVGIHILIYNKPFEPICYCLIKRFQLLFLTFFVCKGTHNNNNNNNNNNFSLASKN